MQNFINFITTIPVPIGIVIVCMSVSVALFEWRIRRIENHLREIIEEMSENNNKDY